MVNKLKVLVSGGGTGGHIFPAIAIVEALKKQADIEVLFVGANGRMEMEKVPACAMKSWGYLSQVFKEDGRLQIF
jgi:UDP-N-acetylglucosamine--N-acetylmuramyl-(pentapeptide) pyrophosphoryl-undecaprenol N-acetylglucosamine transferase